jgi:hypothetical protein
VERLGALPDPEGEGDLLVRASLGDARKDVALTWRQAIV